MKIFYGVVFSMFLVCLISFSGFAQNPIPNPGFENWTLGNPELWYTNNVISLKPITQSSDAYAGNSSARVEILDNQGTPYGVLLYAGTDGLGFPCNQRFTNLSGYFKYSPQPNTIFQVLVGMVQGGNTIGAGSAYISTATNVWTEFNVPIFFTMQGNPDTCRIFITLTSVTNSGAVGYLDELSLSGSTGIDEIGKGQIPATFELGQNYPNPFNPTTNIEFSIPKTSDVKLVIYNQLGQAVATLVNEHLSAGSYSADWNAEDLPSGIYYYRISADDFSQTRKLILMK